MAKSSSPTPSASSLRRFLTLGTAAARIGGSLLGQRLFRGSSGMDWQPVGHLLAQVLGDMKGPVLKLGQMASQWQGVLPEPVAQALGSLQNRVPALPFVHLQSHLREVYGADLGQFFQHIEEKPFAAASLGQVHRAVALDGKALVLKIQYPGIKAICAADLRQVRRLLPLGRLFGVSAEQLENIYQELSDTIDRELDYAAELQSLQRQRSHFAAWEDLRLPEPREDLCRDGVLALTEEPGDCFAEVGEAAPAMRERLAMTLVRWLISQAFELGEVHADPHPGNFAFTPEGQLIVYDFGCTQYMAPSLLSAYVQTFLALQSGSAEALERGFQALGTRQPRSAIPWELYRQLQSIIGPLLQPGKYWDFARESLHEQAGPLIASAFTAQDSLQPAPATLLVNRTLEGHYWNLSRLAISLPLADLLETGIASRESPSS
ncbi:AarF/ABC1/UbiB kinase family protein [Halopseudomonas laoshanensis]|uniref:AarF/ABC1/UbiB kinase family protein n=2 Tax=Halopseudomonas laoshanensis TaxID=2268758 RepID=A0A7V7KVJ5_9GAMM|nr:AarF/ABC1/UbiB kinase family protein [Halopseudomonas laoshanensis]